MASETKRPQIKKSLLEFMKKHFSLNVKLFDTENMPVFPLSQL